MNRSRRYADHIDLMVGGVAAVDHARRQFDVTRATYVMRRDDGALDLFALGRRVATLDAARLRHLLHLIEDPQR